MMALMSGAMVKQTEHRAYHIVEEPGGIDRLAEVETPSDEYYIELRKDMDARHSACRPDVMDHLMSLEAFLDKSILAGFSFGSAKA